ncbi:hypothetical protein PbB2_00007 [Candidatus Phycosocius bacilliformis]|uniref:BioF2-like acetyltransferase domain-containing protein n=1 Tax=Candidatus Phycosocius bacilliformis TaxID=1445552 RepID=A0A2P2E5L8_9PROT|nr:GNAT family N-acetyltransferase [Candidatus Phycosocius bacilliformis]GBF56352.1 hypothetical protein PbB2_00007 [Candidatus Phycosocius bacilliformis]
MKVTTISAESLTHEQIACWVGLQAETKAYGSPLVGPYFAQLVHRHRGDVTIAIASEAGADVAFLAYHRAGRGDLCRPVGWPFGDYQAIVCHPSYRLNVETFLQGAGINRLRVTGLMDPTGLIEPNVLTPALGFRIHLAGGGEATMERLRQANPKWAKNLRRLANKLNRELGPVRLVLEDRDPANLDQILKLKVNQYHDSGMTNVLRPAWVRGMMQDLINQPSRDFGGCLITMFAGDYLVAGQFGVRQGSWFHPWIASTCPKVHAYSPGIVFLGQMLRNSDAIGLETIDLAQGHSHYKSQFARHPITVFAGEVGAQARAASHAPAGFSKLVSQRLDLIAGLEPTLAGRLHAMTQAVLTAPRRLASRAHEKDVHRAETDDHS